MNDRFDPIAAMDAYFDDEASDAQLAALRRWLDEHPDEGAEMLSDRAFLHSRLEQMFAAERRDDVYSASSSSRVARSIRGGLTFIRRPTPLSLSVSALVMGLLITAMAFMAPPFYRALTREQPNPTAEFQIAARLTGLHDAVWANERAATHRGAFLQAGHRIDLRSGSVSIRFNHGANVVLEGPAEFVVENHDTGTLTQGQLYAKVPPVAQGFAIHTPQATVIDLGTEFGVAVTSQGKTHVNVSRGKVELQPTAGAVTQSKLLTAGTTVTVDDAGQVRPAAASEVTFLRQVPQASATVLTFSIAEPIPANGGPLPQDYGDNVSQLGEVGDTHTFYYHGSHDLTPGIAIDYSAGGGGKYLFWGSEDWSDGVGFLRSDESMPKPDGGPFYDTTFTPAAGVGVRLKRFTLDDWDGDGQGHRVSWHLYRRAVAPQNVIAGQDNVTIDSDEELIVRTGMNTYVSQPLILRIQHLAGKGNHLAIDNIHFEQSSIRETAASH